MIFHLSKTDGSWALTFPKASDLEGYCNPIELQYNLVPEQDFQKKCFIPYEIEVIMYQLVLHLLFYWSTLCLEESSNLIAFFFFLFLYSLFSCHVYMFYCEKAIIVMMALLSNAIITSMD